MCKYLNLIENKNIKYILTSGLVVAILIVKRKQLNLNSKGGITMADKIYIIGNGNQAPYGIGEIIEIIPAAHFRKIHAECSRYYSHPTMRLNHKDGKRMKFTFDGRGKVDGIKAE